MSRWQVAPEKIAPSRALGRYDIIGLKFNYKTPPDIVMRAVACVEESKRPDAGLVYCDGNDELTIQWPGLLSCCDVYWKKHALRDRSHYLQRFRGSTNLTDHVLPPGEGMVEVDGEAFTLPREEDLRKIIVGASVGLDRKIAELQLLLKDGSPVPPFAQRENDVILRADVPDNWMGNLRRPAAEVLAGLQGASKSCCRTAACRRSSMQRRCSRAGFACPPSAMARSAGAISRRLPTGACSSSRTWVMPSHGPTSSSPSRPTFPWRGISAISSRNCCIVWKTRRSVLKSWRMQGVCWPRPLSPGGSQVRSENCFGLSEPPSPEAGQCPNSKPLDS